MKIKFNNGRPIIKLSEPVWKVKVGINLPVQEETRISKIETKYWKFKEFLN